MVRIFYSYSHRDALLREELERHLTVLRRQGLISEWHDRLIDAGAEWKGEIDANLRSAQIILLLVSSDFLASNYCYDVETTFALERHASGGAVVIPVILRPCAWQGAPFGHLQALPRDAEPISKWHDRDEAFVNVVQEIRDLIFGKFLRATKPEMPSTAVPEPAEVEQDRVLDAALPKEVTLGRPAELVAMVRRAGSDGLKAFLEVEDDSGSSPEDVKSRSFAIEFPLDHGGRPAAVNVDLRLDSPQFDPVTQTKSIRVSPVGDSDVCHFLLVPKEVGPLKVLLEVSVQNVYHSARTLRTHADVYETTHDRALWVVSMPLFTKSDASLAREPMGNPTASKVSGMMIQCSEGHFYDRNSNSYCPYCDAKDSLCDDNSSERSASARDDRIHSRSVRSEGIDWDLSGGGMSSDSATAAVWRQESAIDPVVGWLVCMDGVNQGRDYRIRSGHNRIGRDPSNEICVRGDETIFRVKHAEIVFDVRATCCYLADGGSRGLVYLNGELVIQPTALKSFDIVSLGSTKLVFVALCGDRFKWEPADSGQSTSTR